MTFTYTHQQILDECEAALNEIDTFYQKSFVNHRGLASDTKVPYTEIVAGFVLDNISDFERSIRRISRQSSYKTDSHLGIFSESSNRVEEIMAMKMFNYCKDGSLYDYIGKVIDYQTPLKSKRSDSAGKIDLLAYDGNILRILELKRPDSDETMLRCVLEGYTYLKTVDTEKLISNFVLPADTPVRACPFVFLGREQWKEMQKDYPRLKELMTALVSTPYYISEENGKYKIWEGIDG